MIYHFGGLPQIFSVYGLVMRVSDRAHRVSGTAVILNAIAEKLKRQSKDDFKGRHFEAWLILQAVTKVSELPRSGKHVHRKRFSGTRF